MPWTGTGSDHLSHRNQCYGVLGHGRRSGRTVAVSSHRESCDGSVSESGFNGSNREQEGNMADNSVKAIAIRLEAIAIGLQIFAGQGLKGRSAKRGS